MHVYLESFGPGCIAFTVAITVTVAVTITFTFA